MDWTILNTIVTIVSIVVGVVGISAVVYYLFPKIWRKKYLAEHNPTPHFEQEMKYGDIYVQPKIEMEDKDKKKIVKLLRDYFFNDVFVKKGAKEDKKVFCILGDTGMGKTAALVNLFVDYVKHYRKGNIPYDIWLYSLADQNVFDKIKGIKDKGKSILLLDAVDENNEAKDDNTYNDFIKKLELVYQDFAFVVTTCRPQFFGDESEVFNRTRAKRDGFFLKCKRLDLVQFDKDQVREYLFNLYYHEPNKELLQEKAERIIKKCPKIAQRPLVLSYINELVSDENKNYETTLDIYDAIVTKLIERETNKTSPYSDKKMMRQWRGLLSEVAGYMYKNGRLVISREEYENFLSEHHLPDVVDEDRKQENVVDKKTFRQRSLLTRTAEGFQFSYKSFYEYFMAYRFFFDYSEIESVRDMDFAIQLFDEMYLAYKSGKGSEHFGIDQVTEDKVANSLYNLGNGLQQLNSFSKAEKEYANALKTFRKLVKATPKTYLPFVATTLDNLGVLHSDTNKHAKAEVELEESLKIRRRLAEASTKYLPKVATTLDNLGVLYRKTSKHMKAEENLAEALKIFRKLAEASQKYLPDVAKTLNNLSVLHWDIGKHMKAEENLAEALEIRRKLVETSPKYLPDVAKTLNNLGILYRKISIHGEAEKKYKEALEIRRKLAKVSPEAYLPDVAQTLNNLGVLHRHICKHARAEEELEESLKIRRQLAEQSLEAYLPFVATTLDNLGALHNDTCKYAEAEEKFVEALKIRRKLAEASSETYLPDVAETLDNWGILHTNTGKHAEAEEKFVEALKIRRKLLRVSIRAYLPYVAQTLNNLGLLHSDIGKHGEAEKELGEAMEICRMLAESSPEAYLPDVAMTLNNLGLLHSNTGEHNDAEKEYGEALATYRKLAESTPEAYLPYVAGTLFNMALFRMEQGNLTEAAQMAQESLEKYQTMAELSHAAFDQYVEKAKNLLEKIRAKQAEEE